MKQETKEGIIVLGVVAITVALIFLTQWIMPWTINLHPYLMATLLAIEIVVLFVIVLIILRTMEVARWKFNYNILERGKTPENPIKLSIIWNYYGMDFFRVKEILTDGVVKIVGIKLDLGFKKCTDDLYVRLSKNIVLQLKSERMYDFSMKPI